MGSGAAGADHRDLLDPRAAGAGHVQVVLLALEGQGRQREIRIHGDGHTTFEGETLTNPGSANRAIAACLRVVLPPGAQPEIVLTLWQAEQREAAFHKVLDFSPETLRVRIQVPPGEPALVIDHVDVWHPA